MTQPFCIVCYIVIQKSTIVRKNQRIKVNPFQYYMVIQKFCLSEESNSQRKTICRTKIRKACLQIHQLKFPLFGNKQIFVQVLLAVTSFFQTSKPPSSQTIPHSLFFLNLFLQVCLQLILPIGERSQRCFYTSKTPFQLVHHAQKH